MACLRTWNLRFIALAMLFVICAGYSRSYWGSLPARPGLDFYQMWGVIKAERASGFRLGSPYADPQGYLAVMHVLAVQTGDALLPAALQSRSTLDLTATPLLYDVFGCLPASYRTALGLFRGLLGIAFAVSVAAMIRPLLRNPFAALAWSLTLAAAFDPFLLDVLVCNVNSIQLLLLVAVIATIEHYRDRHRPLDRRAAMALTAILVFMVLAKPNIAAAAGLLLCCVVIHAERQSRLLIMALSPLWFAILVALPALEFGTLTVWSDWWHNLTLQPDRWDVPGNYSTVLLLQQQFGITAAVAKASVSVFLAVGMLVAAWRKTVPPSAAMGACRERLAQVFSDPQACYAVGATVLFAVSPLVWSHYYVLLLPVCFWLIRSGTHRPWVACCGLASLLLALDVQRRLAMAIPHFPAATLDLGHALAWLPAWCGVLALIVWPDIENSEKPQCPHQESLRIRRYSPHRSR